MSNANQERENLNQVGFEMLSLCKSQLEKAKEAFKNNDIDLAEEVIFKESHINALDLKIEKDCEKFLALYNPVAIDLRFIMTIRKMNTDLERIGDHAYGISKYVVDIDKKITPQLFKSLQLDVMYTTIDDMFECIIAAYENKDAKIARKVFKKDKVLDKINADSFAIIEAMVKKDNTLIGETLLAFSVIKKLERVGDLIKNIAEEIIFYIDTEVLKHRRKKS
mgnify:CR=1 FL=1